MKRLVSILLLVFAVATGFAQSSTPDYIQKAKVGLTQYYPQFKDYFEPIFAKYEKLGTSTHIIFNSKIHENFDTFEEELTTDRDSGSSEEELLDRTHSCSVHDVRLHYIPFYFETCLSRRIDMGLFGCILRCVLRITEEKFCLLMLKKVVCFGFISYLCTQKRMFND